MSKSCSRATRKQTPAHERDFRSLAVFPIMELMTAKVVVVRADFQGNLIVETIVGPEWEEGGWTVWTLIWKGHIWCSCNHRKTSMVLCGFRWRSVKVPRFWASTSTGMHVTISR